MGLPSPGLEKLPTMFSLDSTTRVAQKGAKKTIVMEALCDRFTYILFVFFGEPGSLNDINILHKSSIMNSIMTGKFDVSCEPYTVNGITRDWMTFLVDGIYPPTLFSCALYLTLQMIKAKNTRNATNM